MRATKETLDDNLRSVAAALAYYASVFLVAVGNIVDKLGRVIPPSGQTLLRDSLRTLLDNNGTGIAILVVGRVLAVWSLTGAMQNVMWGINIAYERETRGFVRRRLTSLSMIGFAGLGVLLVFGLLVLGPHLTR
jgi:uncharacterized BrkB/YihY/UPF0761 family membrane protein